CDGRWPHHRIRLALATDFPRRPLCRMGRNANHPMKSEAQFLVTALRQFLFSFRVAGPPVTLEKDLDWAILLELADAHAVTPMLYSALEQTQIPPGFTAQLRSRYENSVRQSLAQSAELARVAQLFREHAIPFVALKGAMLSQYLYGGLGGRTSGDIDILVKP